jgi:hypothetical protein
MKTCLILALALTLTAVSASEQGPATTPSKPKSAKPKQQLAAPKQKSEKVALTGSYLKRDIRRSGYITDGPQNVVVIDSEMIRNSGAGDIRQLLVRRGMWR